MGNKFERVPEPAKPEVVLEDALGVSKEVEEADQAVFRKQESKPDESQGSGFEKHEKEMEEEEAKVAPEVEAKFRDALALLHVRIQLRQESGGRFPDKDRLAGLIEEVPVFAAMEKGAKRIFLSALGKEKEFRLQDEEVFVKKGMEVLSLFIHLATLKEGGDVWLERKAEERRQAGEEEAGEEDLIEE